MNSIIYPIKNPHSLRQKEICEKLFVNEASGLTQVEAEGRIEHFGKNSIKEKEGESSFIIFLNQFKGPFVILLFIAAGLSFYFKEWLDGIAIFIVIIINAIIGFIMEYQAERSMDALRRLTKMNAKVIRDSEMKEIYSDEVVPGDILVAEAGDMLLADARIVHSSQLQVDESALTGESVAVDKEDKILDAGTSYAERVNMIYKGTFVTKGNLKAIVTATGMQTELGKIAAMVQSAEQTVTPLEKKIVQFSKKIIVLTLILILFIFLAGVLHGDNIFELLQTSIALSVAAIPEGLPIVTTLALAQGMLRMSRHNVIVKRLEAVETLGGTNVICTDKTGTLTQNKIEVSSIFTPDGKVEIKTEQGQGAKGKRSPSALSPRLPNESFDLVKKIAVLCNTAELIFKNGDIKEVGDPLETGLLKFVYSEGIEIESFREQNKKLKEEPFSSETKIMATLHASGENYFIGAKGAVEELLKRCTHLFKNGELLVMDESLKRKWIDEAETLAQSGLRIIASAFREVKEIPEKLSEKLVFAGLIGMLDPPREEIYSAIQESKSAGINVVMITGDHPATARNIGIKLGLIASEKEEVIHGKDMSEYENISEDEKKRWLNSKIFARVSPKQKLDIVKVLQENNLVVGMTGDGVNDAPALQKADIGIAMGQRGTQVAQEVADMILKDDSFSSIVLAVKQGRIIFENIQKFVMYLLSCNLSELFIISFSSVINLHYTLFPLQILYINLVTDVLPALALGFTEGSASIMKQPPKNLSEQIIDRKRWVSIITYALVITVCCLSAVTLSHYTLHKEEAWNPELCNNILFITLILCQLWNVFNMTNDTKVLFFRSDVFRNKYIWFATIICLILTIGVYFVEPAKKVLALYRPSIMDFAIIFGFSFLSIILIQLLKRTKIVL